jgi:hypothetical protein
MESGNLRDALATTSGACPAGGTPARCRRGASIGRTDGSPGGQYHREAANQDICYLYRLPGMP